MAEFLAVPRFASQVNVPSFQTLTRSKGWPSLTGKALCIPARNLKRSTLCTVSCRSVGGNGAGTTTITTEKPKVVPADVVLGRSSFPEGFTFGTASSAYQIEGAWNEGGRGPSIWDTFTHEQPNKIKDGKNGDVATDAYHRYKEDIQIMKNMGVDSYRFSISWSRILPDGTVKGGINQEGINYYNNVINELIANGITPYVTIFHWDLPQALEEKYGGFRNRAVIEDFSAYAKICFQEFGDRVKNWITLNEPWSFSTMGYSLGRHAPGRCSIGQCPAGDSRTEPYIVTHNLILAHAAAVKIYRDQFQALQQGEIGITLVSMWYMPYTNSYQDKAAAERLVDSMLGWYMDPLVYGDYPFNMRALVKERLPFFTKEESEMIKGSYDFIGINYYSSRYARSVPITEGYIPYTSIHDAYADQLETNEHGIPIGNLQGSWIYVVPDGLNELLLHIKERYNNPKIYITENGTAEIDNPELPVEEATYDENRLEYLPLHLAEIRAAIQDGVKVAGYFAWSITDNFEWNEGYTERFGLNYIDYTNDLKRHPKASSNWFTKFLGS